MVHYISTEDVQDARNADAALLRFMAFVQKAMQASPNQALANLTTAGFTLAKLIIIRTVRQSKKDPCSTG